MRSATQRDSTWIGVGFGGGEEGVVCNDFASPILWHHLCVPKNYDWMGRWMDGYLENDGAEAHEEGVAAGGAVALHVEQVLVAGLLVDGPEVLAAHLRY